MVGANLAPSTHNPPLKQPLSEGSPWGNGHHLVTVPGSPLPAAVLPRARHCPAGLEGTGEERLGPEVFLSAAAGKDSHLWGPNWLFRFK